MITPEQALEHQRRRRTRWGQFCSGCLIAEAVLVSIAGAWEIGQRIRDHRVLMKSRP